MLFPLWSLLSSNDFNDTVSHFPRLHQAVGMCYPSPPHVIASCPRLLIHDLHSVVSGCSHGGPCGLMKASHWASHQHTCGHRRGFHGAPALSSSTRLGDKGLAHGRCLAKYVEWVIRMLLLPGHLCRWVLGTCSISALLSFPPPQPLPLKWKIKIKTK